MANKLAAAIAALNEVAAKQAAQNKPAPRKFASLSTYFGPLEVITVATEGTVWTFKEGAWIQLDDLPSA